MDRFFSIVPVLFCMTSLHHAHGQIKGMFLNATTPMSYSTAVSYCNEKGMTLPSTLSMIEHDALTELMNTSNSSNVWLSVRRVISEEWLSVNGSKEPSKSGIQFPRYNETADRRCIAIRTKSIKAVNCFKLVDGALCYHKECALCLPWNCARLEEGCIWVIFGVPSWYTGRSECRSAGGDLWTLSNVWENDFAKLKLDHKQTDFWLGWRKDNWVIEKAGQDASYTTDDYFENEKGTEFSCAVIPMSNGLHWEIYNCNLTALTVCQNRSVDECLTEHKNRTNTSTCPCSEQQCGKPGSMMITVLLACLCPLLVMTFGFYLCIRRKTRLREFTKRYRERLHQSRIMEQLYDTLTFSRDRPKSHTAKSSAEETTKEMPVYAVVRKKSRNEKETPGSGFHCTALGDKHDANNTEVSKREEEKDSLVSERDKYGTYINLEE